MTSNWTFDLDFVIEHLKIVLLCNDWKKLVDNSDMDFLIEHLSIVLLWNDWEQLAEQFK